MPETKKSVLLFGGGGCHDFAGICVSLEKYLNQIEGFTVRYVKEDYDIFRAENLVQYDLCVLYHTGGILSVEQKRGLGEWVAEGNGFVGIHSAADSFRDSPEYIAMLGGIFIGHPFIREYLVSLKDINHPVTKVIEGYTVKDWEKFPVYEYKVRDEQYLLDYDPRVHILATTVYQGVLWPVAWVKRWGKGKVFYLALGHDVEACQNQFFQKVFVSGARWAAEPESKIIGLKNPVLEERRT